jgi:hypothetical protein
MRTMQLVGAMLILVGLLLSTNVLALVTVVVDNTPPYFGSTCPTIGSEGAYTYNSPLTSVWAIVNDDESGVDTVIFYWKLKTATEYNSVTLTYSTTSGRWVASVNIAGAGDVYQGYFEAKNKAGLTQTYPMSGYPNYFTVGSYIKPAGKWYINNQEITSSTQTVYSTSLTVTFKFVKTAGTIDTCAVFEGNQQLFALTQSGDTWTGSYTFTPGTHTLKLIVSDGITDVIMSTITLQTGEELTLPPIGINQLLGVVLIAVGAVLALRKKTV